MSAFAVWRGPPLSRRVKVGLGVVGGLLAAGLGLRALARGTLALPAPGTSEGATSYAARVRVEVARHPELRGHEATLFGLLAHESAGFDPVVVDGRKRSPTGALGIAQFTGVGAGEVRRLMELRDWRARFDDAPQLQERLLNFQKDRDAITPAVAIPAAALFLAFWARQYRGNLDAALTQYNAGTRAAQLVAARGSHAAALPELRALPANQRSQADVYVPWVVEAARAYA